MREGWLCPRCKKVNSPDVKQCDCKEIIFKIDRYWTTIIPWYPNLDEFYQPGISSTGNEPLWINITDKKKEEDK